MSAASPSLITGSEESEVIGDVSVASILTFQIVRNFEDDGKTVSYLQYLQL